MGMPNRYDNFKFEPYQYREYPKWVQPPAGTDGKLPEKVLVEDRDEERLVLRQPRVVPKTITEQVEVQSSEEQESPIIDLTSLDNAPEETVSDSSEETSDQLNFLRKRATELGVVFSERWGVTKLSRAIKSAQDSGNA